jgi:putative ABC transport system ATP-binding protein
MDNFNNISQQTPIIQTKNLTHSFDYPLFKNIDFVLNEKQTIAIVGASGCGKSTFLNILSSLLKPNSGEVLFNGKDIYSLNKDELLKIRRNDFGIIFQSHYLFRGFNATENLEIASLISENSIDTQLLEDLNIDHVMEQNIGELSGGQQQRLSISRVLTKKPKIIFADEPTGNLDKETACDVMNELKQYVQNNNASMVIVTHEDSIAMQCDEVYKFEENILKRIK